MLEVKMKDENKGRNVRKLVNFILIFTEFLHFGSLETKSV
jgi:hypothetical protein